MGTSVKREVSLTSDMTLTDIREFYEAAVEMGVPLTKTLAVSVTKGYSDFREHWPDSVTITARP